MQNSPFNIAYQAGTNFAKSFKDVKEQGALDNILSEAMSSNDPDVLNQTLAKVISQVSPEKQAMAGQLIQNKMADIAKKKQTALELQAAKEGGYNPYDPAGVKTQKVKDKNKNERLKSLYGNKENGNQNDFSNLPVSQMSNREQLITLSGHPDKEVSEPAKARLKELQKQETENRADIRELRKEVAPLKQNIIQRADIARTSISNKNHLLQVIDKGNLDDPTYAIFAEQLPFNLGKRLLSEDTVEYKGALVDEYNDMKNVFKGATRVKEVEIYEDKLADLYLTDDQKKAVLKSRIKTLQIDIIREDAAAEIEVKYPNLSALQFNKKVDELTQEKMNSLFNYTWEDQKFVIDQAENMKKIPLTMDDPDSKQIFKQLLQESGGDLDKAKKLAQKKGYTIGN